MTGDAAAVPYALRVCGRVGPLLATALGSSCSRYVEGEVLLRITCTEGMPLDEVVSRLHGLGLSVERVRLLSTDTTGLRATSAEPTHP